MRSLLACTMAGLVLLLFWPANALAARPVIQVGVLFDGPWEGNADLLKLFRAEIDELLSREFDVRFPADRILGGNWQKPRIDANIDSLMADSRVRVVLALGLLSGQELARRGPLPKPAIAALVADHRIQGLPSRNGSSGVRNFTYVTPHRPMSRDLSRFRELVPYRHLAILCHRAYHDHIPELAQALGRELRSSGVEVSFVPVQDRAAPALDALPEGVDAVYLTPVLLPKEEFQALLDGLAARRLPSFSYLGRDEVEQGVLATVTPATEMPRLARRTALNLQRLLLGEAAAQLPVVIDQQERLTLNMATARAIGYSPTWDILTEAELLEDEPRAGAQRWTLAGVVQEALRINLDLAAADQKLAAGQAEVGKARAGLLPQLQLGASGNLIDADRARASFGTQAEETVSAGLALRQSLYSETAWANFDIQKQQQRGREEQRRQLRLDVVQDATTAYLNVLRAKTLQTVQRNNLRLTRSNLELARMRREVGFSGPAEVYRWESQLAQDRRAVIDADVARSQAELALNRILHRPLEQPLLAAETGLDDPQLITSDPRLLGNLATPREFARFRDFMVREGLAAAPELQQLDAALAATERAKTAAARSFWVPDLSLHAGVSQLLHEGGAGAESPFRQLSGLLPVDIPEADDTSWNVGLQLSLPLFTGGARRSELARTRHEMGRLHLERRALADRLEQRIRTALQSSRASHAGIRLSRQAAVAATQNLELVTDAYSRGVVSILELLDAQNAALAAEQAAANAVFDFLLDLMAVQRATGQFDFFTGPEEREAWFVRLAEFLGSAPTATTEP